MSERACILRQERATKKARQGEIPARAFDKCIDCAQGKAIAAEFGNGAATDFQLISPDLARKILKPIFEATEGDSMRKAYSDEEKQFLIDNIDSMTNKQLGEKLGRSEGAISVALYNFGLKRNKNRKPAATLKPGPIAAAAKSNGNCLSIDFTDYPDILEGIRQAAKEDIRTPESQALFWLKSHLNGGAIDD